MSETTKKQSNGLTAKQERFAQEYLIDSNATQAAIRAGYSAKTAGSQAFDLLQKPEIQHYLNEARNRTAQKLEITRERVLAEYAKMAFADPRKFFREDGTLKLITELDNDTAAALAAFEVTEEFDGQGPNRYQVGDTKKIKWADKRAALDSINRMMGWNQDKVTLKGDAENPLVMLLKQVGGTSLPVVKETPEE